MNAPMLADGAVIGPFEIRGQLGLGGMGVVYRAFDRRHHGEVALKLLADQVAADAVCSERFRREARAAFELRNPYVVPVHDFGEIDDRPYISMQMIDGRDLSAILADGALSPVRAVGILRQAAQAVDAVHRANLIHRDVKPSNLMVLEDQDDFTYLVDFGIAHMVGKHTVATSLTSTGATLGTLAYMAPERLHGDRPIDGRVDVYALACVLFEMLTGRPPYPQADHAGLIAAHLFQSAPTVTGVRPDLSPAWDALIARGMGKDPEKRHATAQELAMDARRVLDEKPVAAQTVTQIPASPSPIPVEPAVPPPYAIPAQRVTPPPGGVSRRPGAVPPPGRPRRTREGVVVAVVVGLAVGLVGAVAVWLGTLGSGLLTLGTTAGPGTAPAAISRTVSSPAVQEQSMPPQGTVGTSG